MAHLQTDGARVFSQLHNEGMTSHLKRSRDLAQLAKLMIDIAGGEVEDREPTPADRGKNAGAAALGRLGRKARASSLSKNRRREIA